MKKNIKECNFTTITKWRGDSLVCPQAFGGDVYCGCSLNCFFCFCRETEASMFQKYFSGWDKDLVRKANPDDYKKLFDDAFGSDKPTTNWSIRCLRYGLPFNMGSKSESFMFANEPIMIRVLELFREYQVPVIFETKTIYAGLKKYLDIIKDLRAAVIVSIMGGSDTLNYKLENNAPPASSRWLMVEELNRLGIWTGVRWEPVMPTINGSSAILKDYAGTAAKHKVKHVSIYNYRSSNFTRAKQEFEKRGFNYIKMLSNSVDEIWKKVGGELFQYLRQEKVKVSSPDWVNFPFDSDCISCCGTDELFKPYLFNFQYAISLIKKRGKVEWGDMVAIEFKEPNSYDRMKKSWNGGGQYYNLTDCEDIIIIGQDQKGYNVYGRKERELPIINDGYSFGLI